MSGSSDDTIKIWNITTGECLETLEGHSDIISSIIKINRDIIVSGSYDKSIKIWELTGKCLRTLEGHVFAVNCLIRINETVIASGGNDNSKKIWNITTGSCIRELEGIRIM